MSQEELEQIVSEALSDSNPPDVTFSTILKQITFLLQDVPEEERTSRRQKLMCVLERKFAGLLEPDEENEIDEDKKQNIVSVAEKIAAWMEGIMDAAENREDSTCSWMKEATPVPSEVESEAPSVQLSDVYQVTRDETSILAVTNINRRYPSQEQSLMDRLRMWDLQGPVEGADMHNWAEWMAGVTRLAEDWAAWINQTVAQAKIKGAMKRGEMTTSQGELETLTRADWNTWKERISMEATTFTRVNQSVQQTAGEWSKMFVDPASEEAPEEAPEEVTEDVPEEVPEEA